MGTTTLGLSYPEGTDPVTDGAAAIQELAEDADTLIGGTTGGVTAGANMAAILTNPAYRRGRTVLLRVENWTTTGAISINDTIGTLAAGFRPVIMWRGLLYNYTDSAGFQVKIDTDGTIKADHAIGSGKAIFGSVAFPI